MAAHAILAPLTVPVELRLDRDPAPACRPGRWFRLAGAVSEEELSFLRNLPPALTGLVSACFRLPDDPEDVVVRGLVVETGAEEDRSRRALRFVSLGDDLRTRIARYVAGRMPPEAP